MGETQTTSERIASLTKIAALMNKPNPLITADTARNKSPPEETQPLENPDTGALLIANAQLKQQIIREQRQSFSANPQEALAEIQKEMLAAPPERQRLLQSLLRLVNWEIKKDMVLSK